MKQKTSRNEGRPTDAVTERPNRIYAASDDHPLVTNAGLILQVRLAHYLGLGELLDRHADVGDALGRVNAADKLLTLEASRTPQWGRVVRIIVGLLIQ